MTALLLLAACGREAAIEAQAPGSDTVVVFSAIDPGDVEPLFEAYSERTGTSIVTIHGDPETLTGGAKDKQRPEPDLFIAGNLMALTRATERNLLRPTRSEVIRDHVPADRRDPEHFWIALGVRARAVAYNTRMASAAEMRSVSGYASLADASWRGRLCLASSAVAANTSLIARFIDELGDHEAEMLVRHWQSNLAASVLADDAQLLEAIAAGRCAAGIADTSAIARFLQQRPGAELAAVRFSADTMTHVEISGGGVTRHARNPQGAAALLEWLTTAEANSRFAAARFEFPANPEASQGTTLAFWPAFEAKPSNLAGLGFLTEDAIKLAERARYP